MIGKSLWCLTYYPFTNSKLWNILGLLACFVCMGDRNRGCDIIAWRLVAKNCKDWCNGNDSRHQYWSTDGISWRGNLDWRKKCLFQTTFVKILKCLRMVSGSGMTWRLPWQFAGRETFISLIWSCLDPTLFYFCLSVWLCSYIEGRGIRA